MKKEDIENLKEMLVDFEEYSTDYTKTRCEELEETIKNTLGYIHNLQQENQQLKNILTELERALKDHKEIKEKTNTKEYYIEIDEVLDTIQELKEKYK